MRPIPFAWLKYASWFVFVQAALFVLYLWYGVATENGDAVLALGISVVSVFTYPNMKNAGWGFWGGRNLCPNLSTFIVALIVLLISAVPFWISLFEGNVDYLFYLGWLIPGLLILRAYATMAKAYADRL